MIENAPAPEEGHIINRWDEWIQTAIHVPATPPSHALHLRAIPLSNLLRFIPAYLIPASDAGAEALHHRYTYCAATTPQNIPISTDLTNSWTFLIAAALCPWRHSMVRTASVSIVSHSPIVFVLRKMQYPMFSIIAWEFINFVVH